MAPLGDTLVKCFSLMATGSQNNARVVKAVCDRLSPPLYIHQGMEASVRRAAVLPCAGELLQAAGWLYPCFMPSSRLAVPQQAAAQTAWTLCVYLAGDALRHNPVLDNMEPFLQLVQGRTAPPVPGALVWLEDMAAQLVPGLTQEQQCKRLVSEDKLDAVVRLCCIWDTLAGAWAERSYTAESARMHLQPHILRLVAHVAMQPRPPAAAGTEQGRRLCQAVLASLFSVTLISGGAMDWGWYTGVVCIPGCGTPDCCGACGACGGQRTVTVARPLPEQTEAVLQQEAFWWGGVAALAGVLRRSRADVQTVRAALSSISGGSSGAANSSGNSAGDVCPRYHRAAVWPLLRATEGVCVGSRPGAHCLELLLMREALGHMPGALQQLQPFRAAQDASSSSSSSSGSSDGAVAEKSRQLILQWPMNMLVLIRGDSGSMVCPCRMPTCYLCTPPAPVTLQQLCLLLEVVCLTCQDFTTLALESSPQALQAPLLLALLLQRAYPGVKAAFLNSEDGTRLLVALQLVAEPSDVAPGAPTGFAFYNRTGALSLRDLVGSGVYPWQFPAICRAVFTLAWCLLDVDLDAAAAAAAAGTATGSTASSPSPSASSSSSSSSSSSTAAAAAAAAPESASVLTPAAVSHGSVLCVSGWARAACFHMFQVPAASLRLAAGVQPSLALFATLEALLRQAPIDCHPMLLATLLAAVNALLEPEAPGGCGCSQQVPPASGSGVCAHNSSSSSSTQRNGSDSSRSARAPGPGVLEAIASVAVSVGKVLLPIGRHARGTQEAPGELMVQEEMLVLSARLSNALLQLALQQLERHHHNQQHQQQREGSRHVLLQLVQASQRLLCHIAAAAVGDILERRGYMMAQVLRVLGAAGLGSAAFPAFQAPADSWIVQLNHARIPSSRTMLTYIHTGRMRLSALQVSAACVASAARQQHVTGAPAAAAAAAAAAASASSRSGHQAGGCELHTWCPIHSSRPAPESVRLGQVTPEQDLDEGIIGVRDNSNMVAELPVPLLGCGFHGCNNLAGPSEAGLVANRRGVVCSGCGVARYCSLVCAKDAWPVHRKVCCRLAAALGREPPGATAATSSSTHSKKGHRAAKPGAPGAKRGGAAQAAAAVRRAAPGGASDDCDPVTDQLQGPPDGGRVCAWCGASSQELLRCGRCKQVWYCGVAHQKAAWKAGHKQECAAAGSTG